MFLLEKSNSYLSTGKINNSVLQFYDYKFLTFIYGPHTMTTSHKTVMANLWHLSVVTNCLLWHTCHRFTTTVTEWSAQTVTKTHKLEILNLCWCQNMGAQQAQRSYSQDWNHFKETVSGTNRLSPKRTSYEGTWQRRSCVWPEARQVDWNYANSYILSAIC